MDAEEDVKVGSSYDWRDELDECGSERCSLTRSEGPEGIFSDSLMKESRSFSSGRLSGATMRDLEGVKWKNRCRLMEEMSLIWAIPQASFSC